MSRALGIRIDPVLVVVASVAFGATEAVAPRAMVVAGLVALAALARRVGRVVAGLAALGMLVGAARARHELDEYARAFERARAFLASPSRCSARGRVTASPTWLDQRLRVEARLTELDCEGRRHEGEWPARLQLASDRLFHGEALGRAPSARSLSSGARDHPGSAAPSSAGVPPDLARGDEFSVVADLAPVSEFRNFLLPDPRPRVARRGVLLSGGALSFEIEARAFGVSALIDRARGHVRERILATFGERVSGMARALVLGENDLDPADEKAFQRSGLSHLLAVSGTHLILAVLALLRGLEAVARRVQPLSYRLDVRRPVALLGCCLGPLYADFAGGSGSAWRAAWMLCAVLGVRAAGRHVFPSRVLAASLGAGWLSDALVVFDPSFSLSMAATTGLLAFGQRQQETLLHATLVTQPRRPDLARLAATVSQAALTTLAATLPCVPILLAMSPGLSLASVAANLLAAPVGEALALPLCLVHALCAPIPALEQGLALVASGALGLIRAVAHGGASVGWLYFDIPPPTAWHHAAVIAGASACIAASGRGWLEPSAASAVHVAAERVSCAAAGALHRDMGIRRGPATRLWGALGALRRRMRARRASKLGSTPAVLATLLALIAIEGATRWQHSATRMRLEGRLRITALDVGQGDATLIDLPDGRLMLIDGGGFVGIPIDPGERVILPTLRARRRERIDILVLTHPHPDHYGGLASVVREVDIGEFWYGGPEGERAPPQPGPSDTTARASGARRRASAGSSYSELLALLRWRGVPLRSADELCTRDARVDATLQLLHPCATASAAATGIGAAATGAAATGSAAGTGAPSANDASLVVRVNNGRHTALLVGDAEHWAEQRLLATRAEHLDADFLKVGHHGSRTSSSAAFLARVTPRVATISAGIRNRFGHPHAEALAHLAAVGARTLRLDQTGAASWESDGNAITTTTFAPERPP